MRDERGKEQGCPLPHPSALIACLVVVIITLTVYFQTGNHTFFILDKNDHVTENPFIEAGLTANSVKWAFSSVAAFNWHPVTWLSHMTTAQFFGMDPRAHHLANVIIHSIASASLFLLFVRLTRAFWQSLFVAVLFALHPLHVESVAWVAERKDLLSAFFCFLTLFLYSEYAAKQKPLLYALALFSFMLGLMSKSMLVTLPIVMLLIDYWPLDRYRFEKCKLVTLPSGEGGYKIIKEKIPFFACSLVTGLITIYAQRIGGATKNLEEIPFLLRSENALTSYVKYITKTLWPADLGVLYPIPSSFPFWQTIGALLLLLLISTAVVRWGQQYPYLPVGWFWFIITLLPVIGLIQVGSQSMADRYMYIPVIGLLIIAAWGVADLTRGLRHQKRILALLAGMVVIASAILTWRQLGYWMDSTSILRHTLHVTKGNYLVHDLLGMVYAEKGDLDAALNEYQAALQINPNDAKTRSNLGIIHSAKGDLVEAVAQFRTALHIKPDDARLLNLLAGALAEKGDLDAAIREYRTLILIKPDDKNAQTELERVLAQKRMTNAAGKK